MSALSAWGLFMFLLVFGGVDGFIQDAVDCYNLDKRYLPDDLRRERGLSLSADSGVSLFEGDQTSCETAVVALAYRCSYLWTQLFESEQEAVEYAYANLSKAFRYVLRETDDVYLHPADVIGVFSDRKAAHRAMSERLVEYARSFGYKIEVTSLRELGVRRDDCELERVGRFSDKGSIVWGLEGGKTRKWEIVRRPAHGYGRDLGVEAVLEYARSTLPKAS